MEQLTPQQYELVLKYMETTNEDNFETATNLLRQHAFDLQVAINNKFHPSTQRQQPQVNDQQIVRRYIEYVQRRNLEWNVFQAVFSLIKSLLFSILSLPLSLIPSSLVIRLFGSDFQRLYLGSLTYKHLKIQQCLSKTKNVSSKSVMLIISPARQSDQLITLLSNPQISKKINQNYYLTCYVEGSDELQKIVGDKSGPQLIIVRHNIFDEIVEVGRTKQLQTVTLEMLNRWTTEGRNLYKRDCNVLIKYRNYVARFYGQMHEEEEEEQINLVDRQRDTHQIKQQNQAYLKMEQQAKIDRERQQQKQKQQQKKKRELQQIIQERQHRKMSIPDEPSSGQIVRISFRCPDGKTIIRNFAGDEKVQLIYNWVELNDQIQFEDQKREFEIMYSFPPEPLSDRKQKMLKEVFDSPQEKVVIRQL